MGTVCGAAGLMSAETNKRLIRRYIAEIVNTGDVTKLAKFISPQYVEVYRNARHPMGIEGAERHILGVRETYPDLHVSIEQQIAEGEWVVSRITARGTHRGAWLGMNPTGKVLEITGVNIDRVIDGRIVEHGGAANLLEPLLESGAIRVVGKGLKKSRT
jgi:predicted ester cyclase